MRDYESKENLFENIVDYNALEAKLRREQREAFLRDERNYRDDVRRVMASRRRKKVRREKVLKRVVAGAIAAIVLTGGLYTRGVNSLIDKGYADLNSFDCYVSFNPEDSRTFVAFSSEDLYGSVNPDYELVDEENKSECYGRMYDILSGMGYSDAQAVVVIDNLCNDSSSCYIFSEEDVPSLSDVIMASFAGASLDEDGLENNSGRSM